MLQFGRVRQRFKSVRVLRCADVLCVRACGVWCAFERVVRTPFHFPSTVLFYLAHRTANSTGVVHTGATVTTTDYGIRLYRYCTLYRYTVQRSTRWRRSDHAAQWPHRRCLRYILQVQYKQNITVLVPTSYQYERSTKTIDKE
jgi:hypothetical protein